MVDIATATLSGNLTRDPELRTLPSGTDIARLRVATTTRRRAGEEWVDKANYFTVEAYGAQAQSCANYLCKGSRVFVDAELDWREWTDPQDNKREAVTFRARKVLFERGRSARAGSGDHADEQHGADPEAKPIGDGELAAVSTPERQGIGEPRRSAVLIVHGRADARRGAGSRPDGALLPSGTAGSRRVFFLVVRVDPARALVQRV